MRYSRSVIKLFAVCLLPCVLSACVRFDNRDGVKYVRAPYSYAEKYFNYDGARVCYIEDGNRSGEPIIFIHGITEDSNVWRLTMKALEKDYHVIGIDLPGYGKSEKGAHLPLSISWYSGMIQSFVGRKKLGRVTLVGNSIGGHIVLYTALNYPQILSRAVLVGSTGVDRDMNWYEWMAYTFLWNNLPMKNILYPRRFKKIWEQQFVCTREYDKEYDTWPIFHDPKEFDYFIESFNSSISSLLTTSLREHIQDIQTPTLILWGGFDYHHGVRDAYFMHEKIKNSKMAISPTCGHLLMLDDPKFFNRALINYLKTGDPQARSVTLEEIRQLAKERHLPLMKRFKDHPMSRAAKEKKKLF